MVAYEPVPLPVCEPATAPEEIAASIHGWITSTPLRDLVRAFGAVLPNPATGALLAWLDAFSAAHWDRRNGRERYEAAEPELDPATRSVVCAAAEALGLVRAAPPRHETYQHLLILGGLARACLQRSAYAAHVLNTGLAGQPQVGALGSFRELHTTERDVLAARGLTGRRHEMDAMDAGVHAYFGFTEPGEQRSYADPTSAHLSWSVRTYRRPDAPPVRVLAAPSRDPGRRANTADTQEFWARQVTLTPRDRVLVVTSTTYVPFQHSDAIRTLGIPFGCGVDTIGVEAEWTGEPELRQPVTPGRYLQEIRSAIRSMRRLYDAARHPAPSA